LVDALTGHHLWSERYDRELKDIFVLQDDIIQQIVVNLGAEVRQAEQARVRHTPTDNLTAYDYLLRGMEFSRRLTKETNRQARQTYEKAIELDPRYAAAYAALGWTYYAEWVWQWSHDPQVLERWFALAQHALALDDSLSQAYTLLGQAYLWKHQHEQAVTECERAIALNPNDARSFFWLADVLNMSGRSEEALEAAEKAMRRDPRNQEGYLYEVGFAYLLLDRHEEAITALKRVLTRFPNHVSAHARLVIAYSELGRQAEAQAEAAEVRRLSPDFSLETFRRRVPYKDHARFERVLAALRRAGLE
jgi:adenylate cyclase